VRLVALVDVDDHRGHAFQRARTGERAHVDRPPVDEPPEEDALVCGDDADAKALVLELAERITSGRAVDCGPLASARALEGLTAVIVNVNKRYKAHAGVRVTGLH